LIFSICMFFSYNYVKSQISIINNIQNCHSNSECIQSNNGGGNGVHLPGIGFVPLAQPGVVPPQPQPVGGVGNNPNSFGTRTPGLVQPGVVEQQPQQPPKPPSPPPAPVGCPDEIRVSGFSDELLDGIYEKQEEKIGDRPLYLNSLDVAIAYNELFGDWWIIDKWDVGAYPIAGYAWFPENDGYPCPPYTNTVNDGKNDQVFNVKIESAAPANKEICTANAVEYSDFIGSKPCVFPFTYKGVKYHRCTGIEWDALWCATETTINGEFIDGEWGDCDLQTCEEGSLV